MLQVQFGREGAPGVPPVFFTELQEGLPVGVMAQEEWVAHHDEQSLGPGHSHIEPLGVLQETQIKIQVQLHKALAAPHSGDEDDAAFLALELFHGAHLAGREARPKTRGSERNQRDKPCLRELELQGRCGEVTGQLSQWSECLARGRKEDRRVPGKLKLERVNPV